MSVDLDEVFKSLTELVGDDVTEDTTASKSRVVVSSGESDSSVYKKMLSTLEKDSQDFPELVIDKPTAPKRRLLKRMKVAFGATFIAAIMLGSGIGLMMGEDAVKTTDMSGDAYQVKVIESSGDVALKTLREGDVNWQQVRQHLNKENISSTLIEGLPTTGEACLTDMCETIVFEDQFESAQNTVVSPEVKKRPMERRLESVDEAFLEVITAFDTPLITVFLPMIALIISGGIAIARASPMPALMGVGLASYFAFAPDVMKAVVGMPVEQVESVVSVPMQSGSQVLNAAQNSNYAVIARESATLVAAQYYAKQGDMESVERVVDDVAYDALLEGIPKAAQTLGVLLYTMDVEANGYVTTQGAYEYEQSVAERNIERASSAKVRLGIGAFFLLLVIGLSVSAYRAVVRPAPSGSTELV